MLWFRDPFTIITTHRALIVAIFRLSRRREVTTAWLPDRPPDGQQRRYKLAFEEAPKMLSTCQFAPPLSFSGQMGISLSKGGNFKSRHTGEWSGHPFIGRGSMGVGGVPGNFLISTEWLSRGRFSQIDNEAYTPTSPFNQLKNCSDLLTNSIFLN